MAHQDITHLEALVLSELGETMIALADDLSNCVRIFTFHGHDLQYRADAIHHESTRALLNVKESFKFEPAETPLRQNARQHAQLTSEVISTTEDIRHHLTKLVTTLSERSTVLGDSISNPCSAPGSALLTTTRTKPPPLHTNNSTSLRPETRFDLRETGSDRGSGEENVEGNAKLTPNTQAQHPIPSGTFAFIVDPRRQDLEAQRRPVTQAFTRTRATTRTGVQTPIDSYFSTKYTMS